MRFVLAIVLPPFAVLSCGKPFQFVLNLVFWLASLPLMLFFGIGVFLWFLCILHAFAVCGTRDRNKQMDRLVNAIEGRPAAVPPARQ
jgi:hypothetical protein